MACPQFATLHNGAKMPLLGYGTWQATDSAVEQAVNDALDVGYRHIDTATMYGNEDVIGKVMRKWISSGKLKREDLFVVTKLPPCAMRAAAVETYLKESLEKLQTNYVDVYLIHLPFGVQETPNRETRPLGPDGKTLFDYTTDHLAIWKAMEAQVDAGRAKAIGLSNFSERQIKRILDNSRIKPANLQVELHVYLQQRSLVEFCKRNGIVVTAYSPLGSPGSATLFKALGSETPLPDLLSNPTVKEIAAKHKKTAGQILLKHIVQSGIVTIPKSVRRDRIIENIQIFDFELTSSDMTKLNSLDLGNNGRIFDFAFFTGLEKHPESPLKDW